MGTRKDIRPYLVMTLPAFSLFVFFYIAPVLSGMYFSLTDWNGLSQHWRFTGVKNFVRLLHDEAFRDSLLFTLRYVVLVVLCITPLATVLALMLNRKMRLQTVFRAIYFFPAILSMIVTALIWKNIFYRFLPEAGGWLGLEFLQKSLFSRKETAILGILIIHVWQETAIPMVILLAGMQSIPAELFEVARIDGASAGRQFRSITLPFLIPAFQLVFIYLVRSGILVYEYVFATTEGGPGRSTLSVTLLILQKGFGSEGTKPDFSYGITISLALFMIIGAISAIQLNVTSRREVGQL